MRNNRFYVLFPFGFGLLNLTVTLSAFYASHFLIHSTFLLLSTYENLLILTLLMQLVAEIMLKDYKIGRSVSYWVTVKNSLRSTLTVTSAILFVFFFFGDSTYSQHFLGLFFFLFNISLVLSRVTVHVALNQYRKFGYNFRNAVIIGFDGMGQSLFQTLQRSREHGIKCLGFYTDSPVTTEVDTPHPMALGSISHFLKSTWDHIDFIYVSSSLPREKINAIIERSDYEFVKVKLLPEFAHHANKVFNFQEFKNISIINVTDLPLDNLFNRILKRFFDITFASFVILFVLSWMMPFIALLIKLESKGPVIFTQRRHGRNNRVFNCFKFRTMVENDEADSKWATREDPRVTWIGAILRRTSLDELPQFFNVLVGDMSIVGPRPHAIQMNEYYKDKVYRFYQRHAYKPGITGLAQSMGYRGEILELHHIKSRVRLDRFYFRNWSFLLDLRIIWQTVIVLLKGQESAY